LGSRAGLTAAGAFASLALLVGCGGGSDDDTTTPSTNPEPTVSVASPNATLPAGKVESQPGGAGDEQPNVVEVTLKIDDKLIDPPDTSVPAFFTVRLNVSSGDGRSHTIGFRGKRATVPEHGSVQLTVEGMKAGLYPLTVDGRAGAATITATS